MATQTSSQVAALNPEHQEQLRTKTLLQRAMYRLARDRLTLSALFVLVLITVLCFSAPLIVDNILNVEYNRSDLYRKHLGLWETYEDVDGVTRRYVLGTDSLGRDQLSRLLYAGQISLKIGFLSAIGALTIGIVIGVTTGYFGGVVDDFVIWMITTLDSIPGLFLLLILSSLLNPDENSLILVLVFLGWTGSTRIVRGETFSLREREFILAARSIGASSPRIMFLHITPNVISILLIVLTRAIGGLMLAEASLSFLGFGVKEPTPTWGNMLSSDLTLLRQAPHLVYAPGIMIAVTVLCLYIIGDGLRDAFDPKIAD